MGLHDFGFTLYTLLKYKKYVVVFYLEEMFQIMTFIQALREQRCEPSVDILEHIHMLCVVFQEAVILGISRIVVYVTKMLVF